MVKFSFADIIVLCNFYWKADIALLPIQAWWIIFGIFVGAHLLNASFYKLLYLKGVSIFWGIIVHSKYNFKLFNSYT